MPSQESEALVRSDTARLVQLREAFDRAVANPDSTVRTTELAQLVKSSDSVVVRGTLAKLSGEGPGAAHALRPFLEDDSLLNAHFQILDTIAIIGARDIRLDSVIRREASYWAKTCSQELEENWVSTYGEPPAYHYLRLVSAIKTIQTLGISADLPAVHEFGQIMDRCHHLSQQPELVELVARMFAR